MLAYLGLKQTVDATTFNGKWMLEKGSSNDKVHKKTFNGTEIVKVVTV